MKIEKSKTIALILAGALSALAFSACGSPSNAPVVPAVGGVVGGQYHPPYVAPYANGQYRPGIYGSGQPCLAITSAISFTGNGAEVTLNTITAGRIPNSHSHGQMSLGNGPAVNGQYGSTGSEGTLSFNVTPTAGNRDNDRSNLNGSLQLSPQTIQMIQSTMMPQYGAPNYAAPTSMCVTGISMMLMYSANNGDQSYGPYPENVSGEVYLYLNGAQHGYQLQF